MKQPKPRRPTGRPKIGRKREVRLGDDLWEVALVVGKGNASAGIRLALDLLKGLPAMAANRDEASG